MENKNDNFWCLCIICKHTMFGDFDILGSKHFGGSSPQGQVSSKIQLESKFLTTWVQLFEHNCCFCPKNCICIFAKVCFWSLFSSRLALGSPSCLSSACPRYLINQPGGMLWKLIWPPLTSDPSTTHSSHQWLNGFVQTYPKTHQTWPRCYLTYVC